MSVSYVRASSEELAISASCLSLTTHSFWFPFIDFQTQAERCVQNFLILGQQRFSLHTSFFKKISSYLKNPYSLTKVKTRDSGSLEMNMVGFVVVCLFGLLVVSLALEIHGYTSSEHYKSCISAHSTCDMHDEAPCLPSSNKLWISLAAYYAVSGELYSVFRILVMQDSTLQNSWQYVKALAGVGVLSVTSVLQNVLATVFTEK